MQQEQHHRMKKIRRKSDGKIFNGLIQLCRETGINRTSMSRSLNHHPNAVQKYIDEYEFVND
jgi:DNA-binding phage protein